MPRRVPPEAPTLEGVLERLGRIVEQIEGDELELDRSLALFEEGVGLLRQAQQTLDRAELRVQQLLEEGGTLRLEPFEPDAGG